MFQCQCSSRILRFSAVPNIRFGILRARIPHDEIVISLSRSFSVNLFSSPCVGFVVGRDLTELPFAWRYVPIHSSRMSSRPLSSQRLRCSPSTKMHFLDFLTPSLQYAISDRGTARPPLGSTRVAKPFGDGLGVLREFSEKRTLRRIEHYGYALSGRCILHIAPENRSIGKHLPPTSLRNQKGSGPPSTVSSAVGGVVERLRI